MDGKICDLINSGVVVSPSLFEEENLDELFIQASQQIGETVTSCSGTIAEEKLDELLIQASQQIGESSTSCSSVVSRAPTKSSRFGCPQSTRDIEDIKKAGVPTNTIKSTKWAENVWIAWAKNRRCNIVEDAEKVHQLETDLSEMDTKSVAFWLPKFVVEARKENGECYPPNSLYAMCCGLMRDLRLKCSPDINIFTDSDFNLFRQVLDSQMKLLQSTGKFEKKQSDIISEEIEDRLWEMRFLGDDTHVQKCNGIIGHHTESRHSTSIQE